MFSRLKIVFVKMFFKPIRSQGERSGQGRKRSVAGVNERVGN